MRYSNQLRRLLLSLLIEVVSATAQAGPLKVFVSVLPLKSFVESVGGAHVEVRAMVKPGQNPHSYEPSLRQVAELTQTQLYVRTGVPFEGAWMHRIKAVNPNMRVIDARTGIKLLKSDHQEEHDESSADGDELLSGSDPHIWTSPPVVKIMALSIRDALSGLDPAHAQDYADNYQRFAAELDALDLEIRAQLEGIANRQFMVFHPGWGYFADTYGLEQIAIEKDGKEPGPRALVALVERAKRDKVKVIFAQPQYNRKMAEQLAKVIGGQVEVIDPLALDYLANLRRVSSLIAKANTP